MAYAVHIGKLIHSELKSQGKTVVWFASQINCSRVNAYKIFNKQNIDLELLARISRALDHDFFADLSRLMLYQEPCTV